MTTPNNIVLSEGQMTLIQQAAGALPIEWRERFLTSLADTLLQYDSLTDELVAQATTNTIERLFNGKLTS